MNEFIKAPIKPMKAPKLGRTNATRNASIGWITLHETSSNRVDAEGHTIVFSPFLLAIWTETSPKWEEFRRVCSLFSTSASSPSAVVAVGASKIVKVGSHGFSSKQQNQKKNSSQLLIVDVSEGRSTITYEASVSQDDPDLQWYNCASLSL